MFRSSVLPSLQRLCRPLESRVFLSEIARALSRLRHVLLKAVLGKTTHCLGAGDGVLRVVGHGQSRRVECRIPGADANPYLAFSALLAAGLDGIENQIDPGPELKGNAYEAGEAEAFPSSLREAVDLWEKSDFAKQTFGDAVHKHYLNYGRLEQDLFDKVVTDYERRRMFERG